MAALSYKLLWEKTDNKPEVFKEMTTTLADNWRGFPPNLAEPNPIHVDTGNYLKRVQARPALGGRKVRRGYGYASLSNYNSIP